jgi:hypothetical protein
MEAQAERRATVNVPVKRIVPPPMTPAPKPEPVQAAKYADVAAKNLFSKDRNPAVIVEAPKVEAPKVMPSLPVVYGVIGLPSGTKALMAEKSGVESKSVVAGDTIGEFKVLALDSNQITFEWNGKPVVRSIGDLVDHSGQTVAAAVGGSAAPAPAAAPAGPPTSAALGKDFGTADAPERACKPEDKSPLGTVVDGFRKTGVDSPFGPMGCKWVPNK